MKGKIQFNLHPSQIKNLLASKVNRILELHLAGQHDQKSHGSWSSGQGDEPAPAAPPGGWTKRRDETGDQYRARIAEFEKSKSTPAPKPSAPKTAPKPAAAASPAPAGDVNKQGVKPSKENGYPSRYDGNTNLRATAHAALERAGDIGLDKHLKRTESNGKSVLENIILNGEVVLYKPPRMGQDKAGRPKMQNPVYTFDMPGYNFQLAVAIDPDHGSVISVFPTSPAQEEKIRAWKKQYRTDPKKWQELNRADIKAQVEAQDRNR